MNPEISKKVIEQKAEKRELAPEQKRLLGESWVKMVIGRGETPKNTEQMNKEEIGEWLYQTIIKEIRNIVNEWGLQADEDLIEKIQTEKDPIEKSKVELEYIKKMHSKVDEMVQNFDNSEEKSTKWDSWPARMRETKEFNCVGATLIGAHFLEKAGINSYYGNPYEHVLNIVRLSNGDWWYIDFRNGKRNVLKIEPEEIQLANSPVLKINHPNIDYKLIPIFDNSEVSGSILGNLSTLKYEAEDPETPDEFIEKKEAKEYMAKFSNEFKSMDFWILRQALYPKIIEIKKTKEMQKEISRLDNLRDYDKPVQEYVDTLTKKQKEKIFKEMKDNKEGIGELFYENNNKVSDKVGPELKKVLELFVNSLKNIKTREPETYQELVDRLMSKISGL